MAIATRRITKGAPEGAPPALTRAIDMPIGQIRVGENIREGGELEQLAASISAQGILQPVLVARTAEGFELVAGRRRLEAAKLAGLTHVPTVVRRPMSYQERLEAQLVENLQRQDMNPIEEAEAYQRYLEHTGESQRALAGQIGRSNAHISRRLQLLLLPPDLQQAVRLGDLSPKAALELGREQPAPEGSPAPVARRHPAIATAERLRRLLEPQLEQLPPQYRYSLRDVLDALERLAAAEAPALPTEPAESASQAAERRRRELIDAAKRDLEDRE